MLDQEQKEAWQELKEIWKNSSRGEKINFQFSRLLSELKGKMSQFEKDSIKSDITKIKGAWSQYKGKISQFEKDSINKDITKITSLVRKFLNKLRKKK